MKTIVFFANKGGVGKTRMALLTANFLAASGKRVLGIDLDCSSNSFSNYYLLPSQFDAGLERRKNTFRCLSDPQNDMRQFTLPSAVKNMDIIASSRLMVDLRSIELFRLSRMMVPLADTDVYDFAVIDCQSDYNNITINAINAADMIITPLIKDSDSMSSAAFLEGRLALETAKRDVWRITINGYDRRFETARGGRQKEYLDEIQCNFGVDLLDKALWYPWAADMNRIKDSRMMLAGEVPRDTAEKEALDALAAEWVKQQELEGGESVGWRDWVVVNPVLYDAAVGLAEYVSGEVFPRPLAF
jgi:cellulose biosynthesis protein BcsQ